MSFQSLIKVIGLAIFLIVSAIYTRSPYRTQLPFGSTDLSSVEKQLTQLSPEDRKLVENYVKRSNGDVLPEAWADPDSPFTARTFGQAIELERDFNKKMATDKVRLDKLNAQRQSRLEPLRAVVQAHLIKAEILTTSEFQALQSPNLDRHLQQIDKTPLFVTHIRIENLRDEAITEVKGLLYTYDDPQHLTTVVICFVSHTREPLAPKSETEILCAGAPDPQKHAFITDTSGRFEEVLWDPSHITLASGRELDNGL